MRPGDEQLVLDAAVLFDAPPERSWTSKFLAEPGHHLLLAYVDDTVAGFVSGVETTHPDKGTEMFLYELAVDEPFRRRGIGKALVSALAEIAVDAGATACGSAPITTTSPRWRPTGRPAPSRRSRR